MGCLMEKPSSRERETNPTNARKQSELYLSRWEKPSREVQFIFILHLSALLYITKFKKAKICITNEGELRYSSTL